MKRLYSRLVLWLIRPAIDAALREETRQGGMPFENRIVVANLRWNDSLAARIDTLAAATTANAAAIARELKAREVASAAATPKIS